MDLTDYAGLAICVSDGSVDEPHEIGVWSTCQFADDHSGEDSKNAY